MPRKASGGGSDRGALLPFGANNSGSQVFGRPYPNWLNTERRVVVATTSVAAAGALSRCGERLFGSSMRMFSNALLRVPDAQTAEHRGIVAAGMEDSMQSNLVAPSETVSGAVNWAHRTQDHLSA